VTSHGDQETVISSISAGCDDYIKKPFTLERIFQKLEKFDLAV
jgi:response regulator of citrate/malate metabolism